MEECLVKVAFICVHNSCRSQIAEALGRFFASDVFESFSGGTEIAEKIDPIADKLIHRLYDVDLSMQHRPKLLSVLPDVDIVIKMGCDVNCPVILNAKHYEDWGIPDPKGKDETVYLNVIKEIQKRIVDLRLRIKNDDF